MQRPKIKEYVPGDPAEYAHVKYDGHYVEIRRTEFGGVEFYSRNNLKMDLSFMPNLKGLLALGLEDVALAELHLPGQPASAIKTAMIERDRNLQLSLFAITMCDTLEGLTYWCVKNKLRCAPYYSRVGPPTVDWLGRIDENMVMQEEGFVMKDSMFGNWRKYKPFKTGDYKVVGFNDGNGKYLGLVGSVIVANRAGEVVASVGGFNMEDRIAIDESCIGKIMEVRYQYVGSKGRLRHPTFVRWREDKEVADE